MITVIGAGPAGSYAARLLAEQNLDVDIYEEHKEIGNPIQCTGIVTDAFTQYTEINKKFYVNTLDTARIYAPDGSTVDFRLKDPNIIIDRHKFDAYLAEKAAEKGAKVHLQHRFMGYENGFLKIKDIKANKIKEIKFNNQYANAPDEFSNENSNLAENDASDKKLNNDLKFRADNINKKINSLKMSDRLRGKQYKDYLLGADGPQSLVAKSFNLYRERKFWFGAQATIKGNFEKNVFEVYLGNICPNLFAWIVPENESLARIGLAVHEKSNFYFKELLKKLNIKESQILDYQGGLIPYYDAKARAENKNVFLLGDAATQVKATTAGGIIYSMIAAKAAAKAIKEGKSYEKLWRKELGKDLYLGLKIRNIMNKFSDKDYNYLIKLCKKEKVRRIIERHDREFPSKFITSLLFAEPRLLYFIKNLF